MRGDKNRNSTKIFTIVLLLVLSLISLPFVASVQPVEPAVCQESPELCECSTYGDADTACPDDGCQIMVCDGSTGDTWGLCQVSGDTCSTGETCDSTTKTCVASTPAPATATCQGEYISACSAPANACDAWTARDSYGFEDGCDKTLDVPFSCETLRGTCYIDGDYACEQWNYYCGGTLDCPIDSCRAGTQEQACEMTYTSCASFSQTDCQNMQGCEWVEPAQCDSEDIRTTSCSGTYEVTETSYSCEGTYTECVSSSTSESLVKSFFSLITGNVALECAEETTLNCNASGATTLDECKAVGLGCFWTQSSSQVTKQCSVLDEASCTAKKDDGCTLDVRCVAPRCFDDDEEELNPETVYSTLTYTNSSGTYTYADSCDANGNLLYEQECLDGSTKNQKTITCEFGCVNGACRTEAPVVLEPVLKWKDEFESESYDSTSISNPLDAEVGKVLKLIVENPSSTINFTLIGKESGSLLSKEISPYSDSGMLKANYEISLEDLDLMGDSNLDNIYEYAFRYNGYESSVLYYQKRLGHCSNNLQDVDETGVDCGGSVCDACLDKSAEWVNVSNMNQIIITESINPDFPTVRLALFESGLSAATFAIKERDTAIGDFDEIIREDLVGTKLEDGTIIFDWTLEQSDLILAKENDGDYEFYFEVDGIQSGDILNVTDLRSSVISYCGDGFCDREGGEDGTNCFDDCFLEGDTLCEEVKGEHCSNSPSDCGVCEGPMIFWTQAVPMYDLINYAKLSATDVAGHSFRMTVQNPSATPGDFELKETDSPDFPDEIGTFTGEVNAHGEYVYTWTTTYSDFWNAADNDKAEGTYEFYFKVDGMDNSDKPLVIEIADNEDIPTCDDGVKNGVEEGIDCGGECPECAPPVCDTVTKCGDYDVNGGEDACNADSYTCKVAGTDLGTLGGDQEAVCYWDSDSCKTKVKTIGVGDCNYVEEFSGDTCDDDGFLSYSYDAEFIWSPNNKYNVDLGADYVYDEKASEPGKPVYRYDPNRESLKCVPGERTVQCPAQIQLSFFTWVNLVAALILIFVIYLLLADKKKKKAKKIAKKKVASKKPAKKAVKKTATKRKK